MKKIAVVTNYLPPKPGGIERFTFEFANALIKNGQFKVTVFTNSWKYSENKQQEDELFNKVTLNSFSIAKRFPIPKFFNNENVKTLRSSQSEFDAVIYQSHLFITNLIWRFKLRKTPNHVWINHSSDYINFDNQLLKLLCLVYEKIMIRIMSNLCDVYLAQGQSCANWATKETKIKFTPIRNAINYGHVKSLDNEVIRRFRGISIIFVGRLVEDRMPIECLEIVNKVVNELKRMNFPIQISYTIIGDGHLMYQLKEIAEKCSFEINIAGEKDHNEVLKEMKNSDFMIQMFPKFQTVQTSQLEAFACGLKVISTKVDCSDFNEYLIEVSSKEDFFELLLRNLQRPNSKDAILNEAQKLFAKGYTWDLEASRVIDEIERA